MFPYFTQLISHFFGNRRCEFDSRVGRTPRKGVDSTDTEACSSVIASAQIEYISYIFITTDIAAAVEVRYLFLVLRRRGAEEGSGEEWLGVGKGLKRRREEETDEEGRRVWMGFRRDHGKSTVRRYQLTDVRLSVVKR